MSWSEVKYAVNSTLGTDRFTSLDQVLINSFGGHQMFTENGTFIVPAGITEIYISACAAGGDGAVGSDSAGGAGGKAGEFIIQERVTVSPGEMFTFTVGSGNTIINSESSYTKTLIANSIMAATTINFLGYKTGYNATIGGIVNDSGELTTTYADSFGKPGYGGAFGFGGGGGLRHSISGSHKVKMSRGGSEYDLESNRLNYSPNRNASLVNGGDAEYSIARDGYTYGSKGANAGGYGAGGGGGGGNNTSYSGGKGSPGMIFIEWGGLRR